MEEHIKISLLLCVYGIFKEFRPSEPYLVPYMTSPPLNFTEEQVSQEIFPVSVYSTFVLLVVVFLITDYSRYKIIIIVQAICALITYLMLIFCRGVFQMQIMQVVYGLYLAGEVAYFTYIYAKVEKRHFQEVTSYTRSAYLVGKSLSGVASQTAVLYNLTSYEGLLWITVVSEVIALIWAIVLPSVDKSMYFHRDPTEGNDNERNNDTDKEIKTKVVDILWTDFKGAFTNMYVIKWTFWLVLATGGYYMVTSYVQVLWLQIRKDTQSTSFQLNGAVETCYTLLGALSSMAVGRVHLNWQMFGEPLLAACSLVAAVLLFIMSYTQKDIVAYITFIIFTMMYQTMVTVANSEVAQHINRKSYGLIYGISLFLIYLFFSLFTFVVLQVLQLKIRQQFEVYAAYFGVIGCFFTGLVIVRFIASKKS